MGVKEGGKKQGKLKEYNRRKRVLGPRSLPHLALVFKVLIVKKNIRKGSSGDGGDVKSPQAIERHG